jgi:Protein of unknown function (DUF3352)
MTDDSAGLPSYDVLAAPVPESGRKPATWWVVGGVVALVGVLIGGIAYGAASLSGGGEQPEGALPAGAIAFAKVDLDPAAGQKVDAIRFLRKFPSVRGHVAADADLRKVLFNAVADDAGWKSVNFTKDVDPWLGQRVAVAAYSPKAFGRAKGAAAEPTVVVALQVGDKDKARAGLDRLIAASSGSVKPGYVVQNGYALLAQSKAIAQSVADGVAKGTLDKSKTFAADIGGLDDGIATFWVDGSAASSLSSVANLAGVSDLGVASAASAKNPAVSKARLVYTLRFDGPNVLEFSGSVKGVPEIAGGNVPVKNFAELPATTVAAMGMGGGSDLVDKSWKSLRKQVGAMGDADMFDSSVAQAEQQFGLKLPDDLKLLLGSNMLLAVDSQGLSGGSPEAGLLVTTPDAKRADSLLGRILGDFAGSGIPDITHKVTGDGYVVASSASEAARLTAASGGKRLGDVPAFKQALPEVKGARFALWIDPNGLMRPLSGNSPADLKPIAGLGITMTSDGAGNGNMLMRLVTH